MIPLKAAEPCFKWRKSPLISALGHYFLRVLLFPWPCALSSPLKKSHSPSPNPPPITPFLFHIHCTVSLQPTPLEEVGWCRCSSLDFVTWTLHLGGGMTCEINFILIIYIPPTSITTTLSSLETCIALFYLLENVSSDKNQLQFSTKTMRRVNTFRHIDSHSLIHSVIQDVSNLRKALLSYNDRLQQVRRGHVQ